MTIVTIAMLVTAGFAYVLVIKPTYLDNPTQETQADLGKKQSMTLVKTPDQGDIYSLELDFTGSSSDIFDILISNPQHPVATISLKGGDIDQVYKNDWYSDTCLLEIYPREGTTGNLTISYRFLGLD